MMLEGKMFISTVSASKSEAMREVFKKLGASLIDFPMTEITGATLSPGIEKILKKISGFDWVIFTSPNGAKYFHQLLMEVYGSMPELRGVRIAAIGAKTAQELANHGMRVAFTGSRNTAEDLIEEMTEKLNLQNSNILLSLGNLAPDTLQERLSEIANVTRINVYDTKKTGENSDELIRRIKNNSYDLILFTSPSGVESFTDTLGA